MKYIILGVIQGLTEFLPISSSGHLVIFQKLLGLPHDLAFDAIVHLATALAVLLFFYKDVLELIRGFFSGWFKILTRARSFSVIYKDDLAFKMSCLIITATFVTSVLGLSFKDFFESLFSAPRAVGGFLMLTAVLIFIAEARPRGSKEMGQMSLWDSLFIGLFQGLAIAPGISRSGATISASLMRGLNRELAARFSFILAIPAILGANLIELPQALRSGFQATDLFSIFLGFAAAFISGYLAIKLFMSIIQRMSIRGFAYYCFVVGLIVAIVL